jgi:hypothetical protein
MLQRSRVRCTARRGIFAALRHGRSACPCCICITHMLIVFWGAQISSETLNVFEPTLCAFQGVASPLAAGASQHQAAYAARRGVFSSAPHHGFSCAAPWAQRSPFLSISHTLCLFLGEPRIRVNPLMFLNSNFDLILRFSSCSESGCATGCRSVAASSCVLGAARIFHILVDFLKIPEPESTLHTF